MEQGPVLEGAGRRLGPVTAIAGQSRLQAEIVGEQVRLGSGLGWGVRNGQAWKRGGCGRAASGNQP